MKNDPVFYCDLVKARKSMVKRRKEGKYDTFYEECPGKELVFVGSMLDFPTKKEFIKHMRQIALMDETELLPYKKTPHITAREGGYWYYWIEEHISKIC